MIRLLLALHPRAWRATYEDEYRALLEETPLTAGVVLDVVRHAGRLHGQAHGTLLRVVAAIMVTAAVEVLAVRAQLTENILWLPSSPMRALTLVAVVLPWVLVAAAPVRTRRSRRESASVSRG